MALHNNNLKIVMCVVQLATLPTPRATVAKLSHGSSYIRTYLLVNGFVSYYPVDLILNVSILPNTQQSLRLCKDPTGSHQLRSVNRPRTRMRVQTSAPLMLFCERRRDEERLQLPATSSDNYDSQRHCESAIFSKVRGVCRARAAVQC